MRVLLLSMPFGWTSPSIGLGLLAAQLKNQGIACDVRYANLDYAARMGWKLFNDVCHLAPPQSLLGEWIFAPCLGPPRDESDYLALYESRFSDRLSAGQSSTLAQQACEARSWSHEFLEDLYASIPWAEYDVAGFTSSFHQTAASLALAKMIKQRAPHIRTVMGGANCEDVMGLALHRAFPQLDFVCCGEADVSFPQLVRAFIRNDEDEWKRIPGVIWRDQGKSHYASLKPERVRDLDALPFPDYDDYFRQLAHFPALPQTRSLLMETSRGCWWGEKAQCTFCGLNGGTMTFRSKSAPRVLEELEHLKQRYAATHVEMVDNILDMHYFQTVLPALKQSKLGLDLFYETKANLKEEHVKLLADAGVKRIQPGIESFSTRILQLMKKGSTASQNLQLLRWCKEYGVQCDWNLLYGFPGETADDYSETLALLESLHHLDPPVACGAIRMDRFSPYFERPGQFGISNLRPDAFYELVFALPPAHLHDLAYYFQFDYPASHDHSHYGPELTAAVENWRAQHLASSLTYIDDGDVLTISRGDSREIPLTGTVRQLYLFCRQARSAKSLAEWAAHTGCGHAALNSDLAFLTAAHVLIKVEDRYLALAANAAPAIAPQAAQLLASKLAILSARSTSGEQRILAALREGLGSRNIT